MQRAGGRVRITAQLIHAATDTHLWAKEYERDLADVLRLKSDVARYRAGDPDTDNAAGTRPPGPHWSGQPARPRRLLLGRYHMWESDEAELAKAIDHFEYPIQLDPAYAPAYAGLSYAWQRRAIWGAVTCEQVESKTRAGRAKGCGVGRQPGRGASCNGDRQIHLRLGAETEFRRGIDLDPNAPDAHFEYCFLLQTLGRLLKP